MAIRALILMTFLLAGWNLFGQKTTFYKEQDLVKEVPEKRANFKKVEFDQSDTAIVQLVRMEDDLLLSESKWLGHQPVGVWKEYDLIHGRSTSRDFSLVVYSRESLTDLFDNTKGSGCENCEFATHPRGKAQMMMELNQRVGYPKESKDLGNSGTVYIRFVISEDGTVNAHSIAKGVDPFIDLAVWRGIERMSRWNPAKKDGHPIKSYQTLPVKFVLI